MKTLLETKKQEPVAYIHRQGNHWEVSERVLLDDEKSRGWTEEPLYTHPKQEQGDSICQKDDGCPTELAVLQRFWRGEPIPTEHYPAWFKPAQEPLTDEQFMELLRKDPHLYGRSIYFVYKKGEVEFAGTDGLGLHTPAVLSDDVKQIKRILEAAYGIGEKNT